MCLFKYVKQDNCLLCYCNTVAPVRQNFIFVTQFVLLFFSDFGGNLRAGTFFSSLFPTNDHCFEKAGTDVRIAPKQLRKTANLFSGMRMKSANVMPGSAVIHALALQVVSIN